MDDLFSDDNTPLDFHTIIITQIEKGKSPILLKNYGVEWFNTNIYNYYCNLVRDHISQHSPFDLMSNRAIMNDIDAKVLKQMQEYVTQLSKEKEFPVVVKQVTIGKAIPNKEQLEEMNKTAKAVQAKQTQERQVEVELAREKAERQRAKADKAYREELGLSTQDFINLKSRDNEGNSTIHYLAQAVTLNNSLPSEEMQKSVRQIAARLIEAGVDINEQNANGETVLILLAKQHTPEAMQIISVLESMGANADIKDQYGRKVLDYIKK
jgi:hypothetical protein